MDLFETQHIYKVSEVTKIVKSILEESHIANLWVEGEVSNFRIPSSGHQYFILKDPNSQIKCVIYRSSASRLRFVPEDGISVILYGKLTVYEPRGEYQIVGTRMEPLGVGALQLAFEQLKQRLEEEGLFDEAHKKPIPLIPHRVGVITSPTGAAIRDILNVTGRRFSSVSILLHPARVQGEGAAREIAAAIDTMNKIGGVDVLIVGRGGGSVEDLWAFNEEVVARSIYASEIPVISAVGHEIDFTISDFVADRRAPTPSAAAEMVVANKVDLVSRLNSLNARIASSINNRIGRLRERQESTQRRLLSRDGTDKIHSFQQNIDDLLSRARNALTNSVERRRGVLENYSEKLTYIGIPAQISEMRKDIGNLEQRCIINMRHLLKSRADKFKTFIAELNALSPLAILQRGYSICYRHPSREVIKNAAEVSVGDKVGVKLANGDLICEVEQTSADLLFML
jgi:exodeoxyribonuclease VII large subunit